MASARRVYPEFGNGGTSPPSSPSPSPPLPARAYYNDKDQSRPPPPARAYSSDKDQALPPPATDESQGRRGARGPLCCLFTWLCSILVILSIAIGIAVLVFWLVVQPRALKYYVENVSISGLNGNSKSTSLITDVSVNIMARNPNKHIGIYYDNIHVTVETQGVTIGKGNLPPFYQGHKNTTYINGTLPALVFLTPDNLALLPTSDNSNDVPLYVKADLKVRIKIRSRTARTMTVKVRCNINVDLTQTDGNQIIKNSCNW